MTSVAAIVPARNEAAHIAAAVGALRDLALIDEVVVADDASEDDTLFRAEAAGARTERLTARGGKGAALAAGVRATAADVLVFIDADLGADARIAELLLRPVLAGDADMAVAAPARDEGPSGFGILEAIARWGIRRLGGPRMDRPLSGQRALRRSVVDRLTLAPRFGVEVGLTIDAARAGFRIIEVPCRFTHAKTGRDLRGFAHRARQGWDVAGAIGARALRGRP